LGENGIISKPLIGNFASMVVSDASPHVVVRKTAEMGDETPLGFPPMIVTDSCRASARREVVNFLSREKSPALRRPLSAPG
jgi:hypothetical protein